MVMMMVLMVVMMLMSLDQRGPTGGLTFNHSLPVPHWLDLVAGVSEQRGDILWPGAKPLAVGAMENTVCWRVRLGRMAMQPAGLSLSSGPVPPH